MKFNFKKISAIAVSGIIAGMSMGLAAAANYPAPFVSGGVANAAIVYGTGAGVSSLDLVQAGNIQDSLGTFVTGGTVTVEGGEAFALDKSSNHFNLGDALNSVYSKLTGDDMDFLADGTYKDGDIDEDYSQKITLSDKALSLFADSDYNDKTPTLGFRWTNNEDILTYNMTFDNAITTTDMNETTLNILGNDYYVMTASSGEMELLDSADKVMIQEGETKTIGDNTVTVETGLIGTDWVKFTVNGEVTDKLSEHESYELDDGSYIVPDEILYNSHDSGVSNVEFSIGKGKLTVTSGEEVKLNDETVDGLVITMTGGDDLTDIGVTWRSDGETYLTSDQAISMPVFDTVKLVFNGMDFPDDPEEVSLDSGETMTLTMDNYELPIFHVTSGNSSAATLGDEDYPLITATATVVGYNDTSTASGNQIVYEGGNTNTSASTGGIDLQENDRFLVTIVDNDLSDIQTMYYEVTRIKWNSASDMSLELRDLINDNDITFDSVTSKTQGDIDVNLIGINDTHAYVTFTGATLAYNKAVSEKGLVVTLPEESSNAATEDVGTGVVLTLTEANNDDDVGAGMPFTATVKSNTNDKLHVSTTNVTTLEDANDVYVGYVVSDLASKVTLDETGDEYEFMVDYYGKEVTADVQVVGGQSTTSSGSSVLGNILVKDTEVSSVATKNLIVVGGSCINSAAAALVGGSYCGAAWTEATGIGAGQFLIKGYADSTITSGLALLVAGYDADDTVKAATYLTNKVVDTSMAYKGTTTTETAVAIE